MLSRLTCTALVFISFISFFGCSSNGNFEQVTVKIDMPDDETERHPIDRLSGIYAEPGYGNYNIKSVSLVIIGNDITVGPEYVSPSILELTVDAPAGNGVLFEAKAHDIYGALVYSGSVKADLENGASKQISLSLEPIYDDTPPEAEVILPENESDVRDIIEIAAVASDNIEVMSVEFYIDDILLGIDRDEPYEISWDTSRIKNGRYCLRAVAYDANMNSAVDEDTFVFVKNPRSGLYMLADLNTLSSSDPEYMVEYRGALYFSASDRGHGRELWQIDPSGKAQITDDIYPGSGGSRPRYLTVYKGKLYFSCMGSSSTGEELWEFDGTSSPELSLDLLAGRSSSSPEQLVVYNNKLYFYANGDEEAGRELWEYDGRTAKRVTDINPGNGSSNIGHLTVFENGPDSFLCFSANNGSDTELYALSHENEVIVLKRKGEGALEPKDLCVYDRKLYFNGWDPENGIELWSWDGENQPELAVDISGGNGDPRNLCVFDGNLYFSAIHSFGHELYKYNSSGYPVLVSDINRGSGSSNPDFLYVHNGSLYFQADDGKSGAELWVYDGKNQPRKAIDLSPGGDSSSSSPGYPASYNNRLYFQATTPSRGTELFSYGDYGNVEVHEIEFNPSSNVNHLCVYNNRLYFSAFDPVYGTELFEYDGVNPPGIICDLYPGGSSNPSYMTVFNDSMYFLAYNGNSQSLYEYNGDDLPGPVFEISKNYKNTGVEFVVFNNMLYFNSYDSEDDCELWVYNGSEKPYLLADLNPSGSSTPRNFKVYNDTLYFAASDGNGVELFRCDRGNNISKIDIFPGPAGSNPSDLTVFEGRLFFRAIASVNHGYELFEYNGKNLVMASDIWPGSNGGLEGVVGVYNGRLYLSAEDGNVGPELFVYDGISRPEKVHDINPAWGSFPVNGRVYNRRLLFWADDGKHGNELWALDAVNQLHMLMDINPGPGDGYADGHTAFTYFDGRLFFPAFNMKNGIELWVYSE